jgi:hypothetical protein
MAGVPSEQIDQIFVENPKNLLTDTRTESIAAPAKASV